MAKPSLSYVQYLVLSILFDGEASGEEVRNYLHHYRIHEPPSRFNQQLSRLEDEQLIAGEYVEVKLGREVIHRRRYRITGLGISAFSIASIQFGKLAAETHVKGA